MAASFAFACSDSASPKLSQLVGPGRDSVTVSVELRPATIHAGDTTRIHLTATNQLDRPVTVVFGSACRIEYQITGPQGSLNSPYGGWVCLAVGTKMALAPLGSQSLDYAWTGQLQRWTGDSIETVPLPPGTYSVFGFLADGASSRSAPATIVIN